MGGATESRNGKILLSIIENTPYTDPPQSRIEELLIELKEIIEAGGGGGTTSYEGLTGKPKINGYTLSGDVSLSDIGAASEDDLSEKQDTIPDLSTIRSGAEAGATAVQQTTFETDQQRQETEIGIVANAGAKNVLPITNTTSDVSGITFTVNSDSSVTSSGTLSSGVSNAVFECSNFQLPAGTYTYSCEGAAQQTVRDSYVQKYTGSSWDAVARDYENNTFTLTQTEQIRVRLRVYASGTSGTFKPMLRRAEITDDTFVPYAPTNRELYEMILAMQSGGASTQSTAALMSAKSTIDPDVMPEEGEKQDE